MFMKIFTVIIISFNNIFTIPQNINNDKSTAQSLIRSKRQNNKSYELNLKKSKLTLKSSKDDNSKWNQKWEIKVNAENEFMHKKLPPRMKLNDWEFYVDKNDKITLPILKSLEYDLNWEKNSEPRYWENKDFLSYQNKKLKNIKMKVQEWDKNERYAKWKILEFNAQSEIKSSTDIDLPEKTIKFDGNHNYNDVVDNLDYLMIHRGDFDKFNYSYLYWTPVFNFIDTLEKGYYKEFTIKNHGFKDESYFYHKTSSNKNVVNENVLKIKAFNKTIIAGNKYLQLIHGENEIWKYGTTNSNDYYLIKYLFGTLNYFNVRFSFLRYDPDLKNDIYLYFKKNIPSINNSDYKNVFNEIYEILGNFFASLFYATFDMDEKTHTEIDFKGVENYKKYYFIQIGFFYRSLITFYPKKYLVNIIGNSELLLRSYFFTFDKKMHQDNYNAIDNTNSIYQIDFNVLKSYDNKLIVLPTNKTANSINYLNTDIDIRYGINIFTLTFPLYHKGNIFNHNFKIYDFNVLNSTAFIPEGSNNSEWDELIPPANCKYSGRWTPTFNDIGCAIQNAGIKMLNWMLTASQIITILRPLAIIAKATVNFSTAIFPVFKTVPAFYYTFQFLIGFAIFLMILRIFL
ncbi:hypothetical protein [Spiroplasma endosymbiont of 'Nebria riversi']|uniref:hypothetical protein n=1 Tax=Spiroplasma endosymbiont of 'Nebria riversi' TaxID=2792084 RepID=UPI001C04E988|nr:hypothetical protein [Spiroplasma endosymbiont of 'Nebria riversi']